MMTYPGFADTCIQFETNYYTYCIDINPNQNNHKCSDGTIQCIVTGEIINIKIERQCCDHYQHRCNH